MFIVTLGPKMPGLICLYAAQCLHSFAAKAFCACSQAGLLDFTIRFSPIS
jgi:glyoxylate carboligase